MIDLMYVLIFFAVIFITLYLCRNTKPFKLFESNICTHLELITERLKEQKLKNEQNGYMLEDLKGVIELINMHPICADDVEIITNHFLYLCEYKALHGEALKNYLNNKFNGDEYEKI